MAIIMCVFKTGVPYILTTSPIESSHEGRVRKSEKILSSFDRIREQELTATPYTAVYDIVARYGVKNL